MYFFNFFFLNVVEYFHSTQDLITISSHLFCTFFLDVLTTNLSGFTLNLNHVSTLACKKMNKKEQQNGLIILII